MLQTHLSSLWEAGQLHGQDRDRNSDGVGRHGRQLLREAINVEKIKIEFFFAFPDEMDYYYHLWWMENDTGFVTLPGMEIFIHFLCFLIWWLPSVNEKTGLTTGNYKKSSTSNVLKKLDDVKILGHKEEFRKGITTII